MMKLFTRILSTLLFVSSFTSFAAGPPPPLVKPRSVEMFDFFEKFTAIGQCKSEKSRSYSAKIAGTIDSIEIIQGKNVTQGDLLITIDNDIAEAMKSKAEAAFESAKSTHNRDLSLLAKKIISKEVSDRSKVALETAKADLTNVLSKYENMIITAPFDGYVGVVHARVGDDVQVGDYLFSLIAKGDKTIFVELPESLHNKVNDQSSVSVKDTMGQRVAGSLLAISSYLNENGTITAKLVFPPVTKILHGGYTEAEIIYGQHKALGVPEKTVLKNNKGNFVYKIDAENKVQQVYVKTGTRTGDMIEVISEEIKAGDRIVLEGLTKVYEGASVRIIEEKSDAEPKKIVE